MSKISRAVIDLRSPRAASDDIFLDLWGPLCLRDAAGTDLTPRARKSQGLLALIGVSPGLRRSRAWLQDKLWSDRPPVQGSASLRQCLTEIRTSLGRHVRCLKTDRGWVSLDPARVHVIADCGQPESGDVEFLEGLDIRDAEFEHWIRDQRMHRAERHSREFDEPPVTAAVSAAEPEGPGRGQPTLGLTSRSARGEPEGAFADLMLNLVASGLLGDPTMGVMDLRNQSALGLPSKPAKGPDWLLRAASSAWGSRVRVTLTLSDVGANRLHWADTVTFEVAEFYAQEPRAVGAFAARVARVVQARVRRAEAGAGSDRTTVSHFQRLFGHSIADLQPAEARTALAQ